MLSLMESVADDFKKRHCGARSDDGEEEGSVLEPGDLFDEELKGESGTAYDDAADSEEIEIEDEPSFVTKLRSVLKWAKRSKGDLDKELLAALGVVRISSRTTLQEPSIMQTKVKEMLTADELQKLKDILALPNVDNVPLVEGETLQELRSYIDALKSTTATERLVKRLYDHFCSGLEGRGELSRPMDERQLTVKYLQPLFDWIFQDVADLESFWCEKGNCDLIKSRNLEHNLWDGVFSDQSSVFIESPHSGLVEVSGGTQGCSESKLRSDLSKIAKGMKNHLKRVAMTVSGVDLQQCRKLKVVASHVIGCHLFMQAMCCVGKGVFVMWEWADDILPRSLEDMGSLSKTIHSILVFKRVFLKTRLSVKDMKRSEANLGESSMKSGFSSPIRASDSSWKEWF
ncbi:hypothetical protein BC936DRAFT_138444 [Jimgerdemannia flammicorona]|uniref:Uncharacterized protein n=1 Tax=Jimgerdemannia flammicorona TaxID=994334 RepID=A0A433CG78_9FUNG|nr:hypothetical protein BC936DRAFT_138444 [Jimgerdemannia flammicorona]